MPDTFQLRKENRHADVTPEAINFLINPGMKAIVQSSYSLPADWSPDGINGPYANAPLALRLWMQHCKCPRQVCAQPWVRRDGYFADKRDLVKEVKERSDAGGISISFPQRDGSTDHVEAEAA